MKHNVSQQSDTDKPQHRMFSFLLLWKLNCYSPRCSNQVQNLNIMPKLCRESWNARALVQEKNPLNLSFLMTNLMFFKKLQHSSLLKTRHAWKGPEVRPGRGGEKNTLHTKRISHVLIPLFPSGTNEVINQSHGPMERGKRGPEAYREGGWGGQKHSEKWIVLQKRAVEPHTTFNSYRARYLSKELVETKAEI